MCLCLISGVPQRKRGDIWRLLVEQYPKHNPGCQKAPPHCPAYNMPYDDLLKQLTTHQHAILIDLGKENARKKKSIYYLNEIFEVLLYMLSQAQKSNHLPVCVQNL